MNLRVYNANTYVPTNEELNKLELIKKRNCN